MERRKGRREGYLRWLIDLVTPDKEVAERYRKIFRIMLDTPFKWTIENDDNRAYDGLELRLKWSDSNGGYWEEWMSEDECSMLEMMVALALRCENDIMYDEEFGDRSHEWFWAMMDNSGLLELGFMDLKGEFLRKKVVQILRRINERSYKKDGKGGLFVAHFCDEDFREVEIWHQMGVWIRENFPI